MSDSHRSNPRTSILASRANKILAGGMEGWKWDKSRRKREALLAHLLRNNCRRNEVRESADEGKGINP